MSAEEIANLREALREVNKKLDSNTEITRENTEITRQGFEKMNGRVKKLELKNARREGRESVLGKSSIDWQEIAVLSVKALAAALALAYVVVEGVTKVVAQ